MGSLVGGWDAASPHKAPKGFEDFKEPYTPRGVTRRQVSPFDAAPQPSADLERKGSGPPHLARVSCPPIHGASEIQRYLTRASGSAGGAVPSSPRVGSPGSPRAGTPRTASHKLTLKIGDDDELLGSLGAKEKWCARVESASLNLRPDERDEESWRHGGFKVDDPCHAMHLPGSPRAAAAAAAAAAAGMAPFAPVADEAAAEAEQPHRANVTTQPRVTAMRLPAEVAESFESSGL
ncbi:hypothetical protein ABPG75_008955 [Micractinium tetrahymenae]